MFGIAWSEILIIGIVALVVVPPKDLPALMRSVGKWVGQMRRMAFDFQTQVSSALREAEIEDLKKSVADLSQINPMAEIQSELESATAPLTQMEGQFRQEFASIESDIGQGVHSTPDHATPDVVQPADGETSPFAPRPAAETAPAPSAAADVSAEAGTETGASQPLVEVDPRQQPYSSDHLGGPRFVPDHLKTSVAAAQPAAEPQLPGDHDDIDASKAPLMDHIIELRSRLIKSLAALVIAFLFCFAFAKKIFLFLVWPFDWVMRGLTGNQAVLQYT
eukprot:gene21660-22586_t